MTDRIRVGLISFAHIHAESYLRCLLTNPHVVLAGVTDDDQARAHHFASPAGVPVFASMESLLDAGLDAVVVCTENALHVGPVIAAAARGLHVLCEKPLAVSSQDAQHMVDTCQEAGVILMTAFPMRFNAPMIAMQQMVTEGKLGRILGCNATNQGECPYYHRGWFVDPALAGGGAMQDHIVHVADLLRWALQSEVTEVYAQSNHILYRDAAPDVETGGLVSVQFANGAFASIDCSWSRPPYYATWGGLTIDWVGEGGLASTNAFRQKLTVYSKNRPRAAYAGWGSNADQAMVDEFVAAIIENRQPRVTGEDGLEAVRIVEAAYASIKTGQPVPLTVRRQPLT
jgi:predicted dehydrogenase